MPIVHAAVFTEDYAALQRWAAEEGLTPSAMLRVLLRDAVRMHNCPQCFRLVRAHEHRAKPLPKRAELEARP